MKQGLTYHLAVSFEGISLDDVQRIEFAFADQKDKPPVKFDEYPGSVIRKPGTNTLLVPWTAAETYKFTSYVYMDTRITLLGTTDQPVTPIVTMFMSETLFEEGT